MQALQLFFDVLLLQFFLFLLFKLVIEEDLVLLVLGLKPLDLSVAKLQVFHLLVEVCLHALEICLVLLGFA